MFSLKMILNWAVLAAAARELAEPEVEAAELGAAEDVGGEGHVHGRRRVDEEELLDALGSEEPRPPGELALVVEAPKEGEGEAYGAERAGVGGEEVVHSGNGLAHAGDGEVHVVEDERRGAPGAAPPRGERGDEAGVLGWEAGGDDAEEPGGERAGPGGEADGEAGHGALEEHVHGGRRRLETRVLAGVGGGGGELVGVETRRQGGCVPAWALATAHWRVATWGGGVGFVRHTNGP
jgi:hypothetical protein